MWSETSLSHIKELKKIILKKKIMLGFIIDTYLFWDSVYKYAHLIVAVVSPVWVAIQTIVYQTTMSKREQAIFLIITAIAAGMIKVRDVIKYDQIGATAKEQSVKYSQLYDRIEREIRREDRQDDDDFLYWINREFKNIELADPELSYREKQKFIALCKQKNIPYDEDLKDLENLMLASDIRALRTMQPDPGQLDQLDSRNPPNQDHRIVIDDNPANAPNPTNQTNPATATNLQKNPIGTLSKSSKFDTDDEYCKKKYKESLAELNVKSDLKWAMDRLNNLQ